MQIIAQKTKEVRQTQALSHRVLTKTSGIGVTSLPQLEWIYFSFSALFLCKTRKQHHWRNTSDESCELLMVRSR